VVKERLRGSLPVRYFQSAISLMGKIFASRSKEELIQGLGVAAGAVEDIRHIWHPPLGSGRR
jgi:hypothetical protein